MARKERQGFVIYDTTFDAQLQYLEPVDFKNAVMAAHEYSRAASKHKARPTPPPFTGFVMGAYISMVSSIDSSQREYDKKALNARLRKLGLDFEAMTHFDAVTLYNKGFSAADIATLHECDYEEVNQLLQGVTGGERSVNPSNTVQSDFNNRIDLINSEKEKEFEKDIECEFDRCHELYSALERQGIKVTPVIKGHLRKLRRSHSTKELIGMALTLPFQEELRRLK